MDSEKPVMPFFRRTPPGMSSSPPICSALQSFETALLIMSMGRHPAALVVLAQAIESTIKAALKIQATDRKQFWELKQLAAAKIEVSTDIDSRLKQFRDTRNEFSHYGYSPKDDPRAIREILSTGFPYLERLLLGFYEFDLASSLAPWIETQYRIAKTVFEEGPAEHTGRERFALLALEHAIRVYVQPTFISSADNNVLIDSEGQDHKFRVMHAMKPALERRFTECSFFDCPLCSGIDCLGGEIDIDALDARLVRVSRIHCLSCGFDLPEEASGLANLVCAEQLADQKEAILRDFGLST